MKNIYFPVFSALLAAMALSLSSCLKDECRSTTVFLRYDPEYMSLDEFRRPVTAGAARALEQPGKIYYYQDYLLINELHEGVHVIDNRDPANPRPVSFIGIPGNVDIAIRGDILYADSYIDLVSIDLSDPATPRFLGRAEEVFPGLGVNPQFGVITRYIESEVTEERPCVESGPGWFFEGDVLFARPQMLSEAAFSNSRVSAATASAAAATGTGGSLARFTIRDRYLYAIDNFQINVFDLGQADDPRRVSQVPVGWMIETIFPYGENLFIGSRNGMFIYDLLNPEAPSLVSQFTHAQACDPVFIDGEVAYVTLRDGTECNGFVNQLDVLDIASLHSPRLIRTYPMHHPIGLSVHDKHLYLCEDDQGLKVFDVSDVRAIAENQVAHLKGFTAIDVITLPDREVALVVGPEGLRQFDISDPRRLRELSLIPVAN